MQIDEEILVGLASPEIDESLRLEGSTGGTGSFSTQQFEMEIPNDESTAARELFVSNSENKGPPNTISKDSKNSSFSSSRLERNIHISEPETSSSGQFSRTERIFGSVETATSLQLLASKFWQSTSSETSHLPQTFSSDGFTYLYYIVVLPYLEMALEMLAGSSMSIGVQHKNDERVVQIVTQRTVPQENQQEMKDSLSKLLPVGFRDLTTLSFSEGRVIRACDVPGTKNHHPKNTYRYSDMEMGDSIGSTSTHHAATAGPRIQLGDEGFWVHCYHLVDDHYKSPQFKKYGQQPLIMHPAPYDLESCGHCNQVPGAKKSETVGLILFHSGGLNATRISKKTGLPCIVDYAICPQLSNSKPKPNVMRMAEKTGFITDTCQVRPEGLVYIAGRSSGVQIGKVRKELSLVKEQWSDTEYTKTHELTVDWTGQWQTEEEWNLAGFGIGGDSGAGVIDMESNSLCGQVWGTGGLPRVAYITSWEDIADDIEEKYEKKCSQKLRPTLPQPDGTSAYQIGEPICSGCASERALYLESVDGRLRMIQKTSRKASDSEYFMGTHQYFSDNSLIMLENKAMEMDSSQPPEGSENLMVELEDRPTRSSATQQEEAFQIVAKVFKDLPSFLTQGYQQRISRSQAEKRTGIMPEAKVNAVMVAA
ncbi:hypothetical protein BGZ60DRAFT_424236 [Tricladium varicosporioides]|nr:hypothetical protein BGZ60DRAFT_424236 [Hymenoscyphus varicosporioides]